MTSFNQVPPEMFGLRQYQLMPTQQESIVNGYVSPDDSMPTNLRLFPYEWRLNPQLSFLDRSFLVGTRAIMREVTWGFDVFPIESGSGLVIGADGIDVATLRHQAVELVQATNDILKGMGNPYEIELDLPDAPPVYPLQTLSGATAKP